MTELASLYAAFWTGKEWREVSPGDWREVENGWGFRNAQTGELIPAFRNIAPANAPFPHIVYPVGSSEFFTNKVANIVFVRDRRPAMPDFYGLVDDVLRQMREAIPISGKRLVLPDGNHIKLQFANVDTRRDLDDTTGATVQGIFNFNIRMR